MKAVFQLVFTMSNKIIGNDWRISLINVPVYGCLLRCTCRSVVVWLSSCPDFHALGDILLFLFLRNFSKVVDGLSFSKTLPL